MGAGRVFLPADILGILFRGSQSPGSPDREHEIWLDWPENQKPPLLIRRRKTRPLMVSIGRTPLLGIERWTPDE